MITSWVPYPTEEITSVEALAGTLIVNVPSLAVWVPVPVPFTKIVTEANGVLLAESLTTPVTVLCANAERAKSGNRKLKNSRLRFIMII